jgi:hypothetical protein
MARRGPDMPAVNVKVKVKVTFTIEQATKAQSGVEV